jgi:hypothetical protein
MSIPRKKSRRIVVEGRPFRWMLKGRPRYFGDTPGCFRFVAQEDVERPGRVLAAWLVSKLWTEDHDLFGCHRASVLPSDAAAIIQRGLQTGWDPVDRGSSFELNINLDLTEYEICARKDFVSR